MTRRLWTTTATIALFVIIVLSLNLLQGTSQSAPDIGSDSGQNEGLQEHKPMELEQPPAPESESQEGKLAEIATALRDGPVWAKPSRPTETPESQIVTPGLTSTSGSSAATPTSKEISKIIVMGKLTTEDTDWVGQEMDGWQSAIYYVNLPDNETSPSGLRTPFNKGKETTPYLTYIIDNYPDFPDVSVFIHAHRRGMPAAWHNDATGHDAVNMLRDLRLDTVLERGYVNLRCITEIGCPNEVQPFRDPPDPEKHAEHAYAYVYAHFFNTSYSEMKEQIPVVATPCCAQFALSRAQILEKPKSEYERYRSFIEETHYDDDTSGRVMEYMWHIIFGRDAVHCEYLFDCWCNVYGRCNKFIPRIGGFGRSGRAGSS